MARKDWVTGEIRKQVSVTEAANRHTDHKAELQVFTAAANNVGAGQRQMEEVKVLINSQPNLESRGIQANREKGQATARVLEKGYAETQKERDAIEKNREGLAAISLVGTTPKTKEVFSEARRLMREADNHPKTKSD